jgi:SNF2 family DNA or RNA helicase
MIKLLPHQVEVLEESKDLTKVAYYYDMGLGKTYIGAEKAVSLHKNILVVCQKSKVDDWMNHFKENYKEPLICTLDLTDNNELNMFLHVTSFRMVGIINYDLIWRRPELATLTDFTLMLDESSLIQNDTSKRSKFILKKLNPTNVILLSGTPVGGKYENLLSQIHLLGWSISKELFQRQYCIYDYTEDGFPKIVGYKNVERLKRKLREHGCFFKKTEEVIDLPEQRFINKAIKETKLYKDFMKHSLVEVDGKELVGDTTLNKMLYARQLSSAYNPDKIQALQDLIESTQDRLIIFYNFDIELEAIKSVIPEDRPISYINGKVKDKTAYENESNSITLCQYQSGSMGHNLQKCNKIIYFSPTLSSELYEQSKKRIHRIGTIDKCIYYKLISGIEWSIYNTLDQRKNYTEDLFKEEMK